MPDKYDRYCDFIFVCQGKTCKKEGGKPLVEVFKKGIKDAGLGGTVKLIKTKCTDRCKEAPVVIAGNKWRGHVTKKDAEEIVEGIKNR